MSDMCLCGKGRGRESGAEKGSGGGGGAEEGEDEREIGGGVRVNQRKVNKRKGEKSERREKSGWFLCDGKRGDP